MTAKLQAVIWRKSADAGLSKDFGRFRKTLFVDELGWNLRTDDDVETDQFDTDDAIYCALQRDGEIVAGFRALRTDRPYLAADVFTTLAPDRPYPRRADCWEISRFGVRRCEAAGNVAQANYSVMFRFALRRQASALVAIADLAYERYLATLGIRTLRYGPPQVIGADRAGRPMEVVAGEIPLSGQSHRRFLSLLKIANTMEIVDETLVLGSDAVSA